MQEARSLPAFGWPPTEALSLRSFLSMWCFARMWLARSSPRDVWSQLYEGRPLVGRLLSWPSRSGPACVAVLWFAPPLWSGNCARSGQGEHSAVAWPQLLFMRSAGLQRASYSLRARVEPSGMKHRAYGEIHACSAVDVDPRYGRMLSPRTAASSRRAAAASSGEQDRVEHWPRCDAIAIVADRARFVSQRRGVLFLGVRRRTPRTSGVTALGYSLSTGLSPRTVKSALCKGGPCSGRNGGRRA